MNLWKQNKKKKMYTFFYIILNGKISELPYGPYERIISYEEFIGLKSMEITLRLINRVCFSPRETR